jgi:hypothetical protein
MSTLGHDGLVASWVEEYKARHEAIPAPPPFELLEPGNGADWRGALGEPARVTDWAALFAGELAEQAWPDVVATWVPRLLPGYGGAFTHGLIRTTHAVRGLESSTPPSPLALGELAKGLAYWAGTYRTLPGTPSLRGDRRLDESIASLSRPAQPWTPMEAAQFSRIDELPDFAEDVEALGPPSSIDDALSDLSAAFARLMLANPNGTPFGLVHAITPISGARTLLPYLSSVSTGQLYAQIWHVNAAIASGFSARRNGEHVPPTSDDRPLVPEQLGALAVDHKDPHVVKFTEACCREHALRPDPAYLLAARHVIDTTPAW